MMPYYIIRVVYVWSRITIYFRRSHYICSVNNNTNLSHFHLPCVEIEVLQRSLKPSGMGEFHRLFGLHDSPHVWCGGQLGVGGRSCGHSLSLDQLPALPAKVLTVHNIKPKPDR